MPFYRKNNLNLFLFFSLITYLSLTFANIENTIEIKQIELENDEDKIIAYLEMRALRNNVYFKMLHSDGAAVAPLRQQVEILDEHIKNYLETNQISDLLG